MDDWPKENNLFLCHMVFHLEAMEGGISFRHLCGIDFLKATCLVIYFLPSFGQTCKNMCNLPPPTSNHVK